MEMKTIVPKLVDTHNYLGKPVTKNGIRIGSITDVKEVGDHYELYMHIDDSELDTYFQKGIESVSFRGEK